MALQHFYSRVPARVSMYNRADGFDTFAKSADVQRDFLERELASVYENKLQKHDISLIRRNAIPSVYTQCCTRSGTLVQNCITYLPLDYTGERSAYLSHSLIYTEQEKAQILSTQEDTTLNPQLFTTQIEEFCITAADAVPNDQYPTAEYSPGRGRASGYLLRQADPETVKSLLYAVLYALCGKGRNVCVKQQGENLALSMRSLQLFNEIQSILPYQLRAGLSFASYVNDPAQYANYKLRGVSAEFPESAAKCVCIDLQTNLIIGVQHDEVVANKALIQFFYSLLENQTLRSEFLQFMQQATQAIPSLQNLNLKVLSSMVFLFQCGCSLFPEKDVLPHDTAIYDCLCAYEKYRPAVNEAYRIQMYRSLLRYAQNHLPIPKNIFAKVTKLYPAEPQAAKRIVMNIVLELIHTDIMRDKLFAFIRSNYQNEDADMRRVIMEDLSRVFYGGFLQNPLLTFFSEQFASEIEETKTLILEKLLLSIRTPAVQGKILVFLQEHYGNLSERNKDRFYQTFLEMLPECDALAGALVKAVNGYLPMEPEERQERVRQQLMQVLEADYRRKEHKLLPVLVEEIGFCRDMVIQLAFGPWQSRKFHEEYLQWLSAATAMEKTDGLIRAFSLVPQLDQKLLLEEAVALYRPEEAQQDLYLWLALQEQMMGLPREFGQQLQAAVVSPAVERTACRVFDTRWRTDGMQLLLDYARENPQVQRCEAYRPIESYLAMVAAAERQDWPIMVQQLQQLQQETELSPQIAQHLRDCSIQPERQTAQTVLCLQIAQNLLAEGKAGLLACYEKRVAHQNPEEVLELMLAVCQELSQAGIMSVLTAEDSGLAEVLAAFAVAYGKHSYHYLRGHLPQGEFGQQVEALLHAQRAQSGGFLARLFGKKK